MIMAQALSIPVLQFSDNGRCASDDGYYLRLLFYVPVILRSPKPGLWHLLLQQEIKIDGNDPITPARH